MPRPSSGDRSSKAPSHSGDVLMAGAVEGHRRHDQDGGVDEQRQYQGDRRVGRCPFDGVALAPRPAGRPSSAPKRSAGRGCAASPWPRACRWPRTGSRGGCRRPGRGTSPRSTSAACGLARTIWKAKQPTMTSTSATMSFERRKPLAQESSRKASRAAMTRPPVGHAEEQFQPDGGADHLGQVAGDDGDLGEAPQPEVGRPRIRVAAGLGEVAAGGHAEARGQGLEEHRHQVRQQHHAEQRYLNWEPPGGRRPVAGIHVADRNHVARADKGEQIGETRPRTVGMARSRR